MRFSHLPIFATDQTHGRALRASNRLIVHSPAMGWRSLYGAIIEESPFEATEPAMGHPALIYHLARPSQVTRRVEGARPNRAVVGPRCLCLTPGHATTVWQHSGRPEILQIYLRQSIYEDAVGELYSCDGSNAEVVPRFALMDPLLEQLANAVCSLLRGGAVGDELYVDSLAQMIAAHLAGNHSSRSRRVHTPAVDQISGWRMRRLAEFIEENLASDLTLQALAEQIKLSPIYLIRAFKAAVGGGSPLVRASTPSGTSQAASPEHRSALGRSCFAIWLLLAEPPIRLVPAQCWGFARSLSASAKSWTIRRSVKWINR